MPPTSRGNALYLADLNPQQRRQLTEPAREAYRRQLEQQVNPDGTLPPDEVLYRVRQLRRAMMADLARRSVDVRAAKAEARKQAAADQGLDELAALAAELDRYAS
jgi:hypothetical protein